MKKLKLAYAVVLSLFLVSCASKPGVRGTHENPSQGSNEGASETGSPEATPSIPSLKGNRIALVLGGTGVASYATVGVLKKLQEEGVDIELIVTTGWPTLFSLAFGYLKSVHDLEWFATRLGQKEWERAGGVDFRREIDPSDALKGIILSSFPQSLLNQSRVPVVIAATNTDAGEPDVFGSGDWKEPLLRTLAVPGLYRRFPSDRQNGWIDSLSALEVREAVRRGASNIVSISMYEDYLNWTIGKTSKDDELSRRLYATQMRKTALEAAKLAQLSGSIAIRKDPTDFSAKRAAILAGYREGARIRKLRETANSTTN